MSVSWLTSSSERDLNIPNLRLGPLPPPSLRENTCRQGLHLSGASRGHQVADPMLLHLNDSSQLGSDPSSSSLNSKMTQGKEKCVGTEQSEQDLGAESGYGRGSREGHSRALSHPIPVKPPCWHRHRNLSAFLRAQGHFWGTALRGRHKRAGTVCDIWLLIMMHLGNVFTSSLTFPNPVPPCYQRSAWMVGCPSRDQGPPSASAAHCGSLGQTFSFSGLRFLHL